MRDSGRDRVLERGWGRMMNEGGRTVRQAGRHVKRSQTRYSPVICACLPTIHGPITFLLWVL